MLENASGTENTIRKFKHFRFFPLLPVRTKTECTVENGTFSVSAVFCVRQSIGFDYVQTDQNINNIVSRGNMERFIVEVAFYNFLYDKTSKENKNTEMKKLVWELIGKKFGMSDELKKFIL